MAFDFGGFDRNLDSSWLDQYDQPDYGGAQGGFSLSMPSQGFNYVQPAGPGQSYDWSQPSAASMPGFGGAGFGDLNQYQDLIPQAPQMPQYSGTSDILSSRDMYTPDQMKGDAGGNIANPFAKNAVSAPQFGQMGGSAAIPQRPQQGEDSWMKLLGKTGLQAAGGLATGLIGSAMQGKPQQSNAPAPAASPSPLPAAPTTAIPTAKEMEPLPGTKASPLISGRPVQAIGSAGLNVEDRMKKGGKTGGFQLY